jgi:midasin (ATPase involved in ribosome maturation)
MKQLNKQMVGTVVKTAATSRSAVGAAIDASGKDYADYISYQVRRNAGQRNSALKVIELPNGDLKWRSAPMSEFDKTERALVTEEVVNVPSEQQEMLDFIHSSYSLKPRSLVMNELKWKHLIRSAVRGKNIMMTGSSGSGKTMAAKALVKALDRPDYVFNMGATQDPRSTLIGNVQFNPDEGTWLSESLFVKAIQTPDAVILLDELTRAHPDAWNILMPVLDQGQRYLRLDEKEDQATINVAKGVTFIATANIGNEYTATRALDKALLDRFTVIEMDLLNDEEESDLLAYMFPHVQAAILNDVAKIAHLTRIESLNESPRIDNGISTRTSVEIAGLLYDGFSLVEAAEITIYPQYDASGGVDSERTFVKQIVQKFITDGSDEELFTEAEMDSEA